MYCVYQNTPTMFPDGRVMMLNQYNQWVEIKVLPAQPAVQPQLFQARSASQPPISQASSISEEIAEEVLAQSDEPELAELPTKARASCPVVEEEDEVALSSPEMIFLSSQDRVPPSTQEAESESGMSSMSSEPVDLSEDFTPLKREVVSTSSTSTVEVQKYVVERKVQVRTGPTAGSKNLFVLTPGITVHVAEIKKVRTKTGFVTTKAHVVCQQGQGWVSVNRQNKKTEDTFVFKGKASVGFQRLIKSANVWQRHNAKVGEIVKASVDTFTLKVTCKTWQQLEALRSDLQNSRLHGRVLLNKRTPQLVNLRRVFGNNKPCVHVFDIDVDSQNDHAEFKEDFDWSHQFKGSRKDFQHQVREDLLKVGFGGVRSVEWSAGHTSSGRFSIRDFCTVEFGKDSQLRHFLNNFEKYEFFQGAKVKIDPTYANLVSIPAEALQA